MFDLRLARADTSLSSSPVRRARSASPAWNEADPTRSSATNRDTLYRLPRRRRSATSRVSAPCRATYSAKPVGASGRCTRSAVQRHRRSVTVAAFPARTVTCSGRNRTIISWSIRLGSRGAPRVTRSCRPIGRVYAVSVARYPMPVTRRRSRPPRRGCRLLLARSCQFPIGRAKRGSSRCPPLGAAPPHPQAEEESAAADQGGDQDEYHRRHPTTFVGRRRGRGGGVV